MLCNQHKGDKRGEDLDGCIDSAHSVSKENIPPSWPNTEALGKCLSTLCPQFAVCCLPISDEQYSVWLIIAFIATGADQTEQDFPYMVTFTFPCKSQYMFSALRKF